MYSEEMEFPEEGILEYDGTMTSLLKDGAENNHVGRMFVGCHRESGLRFFTPLPARTTRGSPPPEAYKEVMPIMVAKTKPSHIVSTDSAQSFQKVMRENLPDNPYGKVSLEHPILCSSTISKVCLIVGRLCNFLCISLAE